MLPIALLFLVWLVSNEGMRPAIQVTQLALGGVISVALGLFAAAVFRLPLATLGFVQYLAPSCALMLAIFIYDEAVPEIRWVTFGFIWSALVIFSAENFLHLRNSANFCGEAQHDHTIHYGAGLSLWNASIHQWQPKPRWCWRKKVFAYQTETVSPGAVWKKLPEILAKHPLGKVPGLRMASWCCTTRRSSMNI